LKKLGRRFFEADPVKAAKFLLGKYLVKMENGEMLAGRIVETEAYKGKGDPGSHAYRKKTKRNAIMFGPPGFAYVYFCYGAHYLFNIVTLPEGEAGAVLIRALEPVSGIGRMMKHRKAELFRLTNGPAKLTQAFSIGRDTNGADLTGKELYITAGKEEKFTIGSSPRIGIRNGAGLKWRFFIKGNSFVSKAGNKP
jgi:DNA-3-methyladenine glycosylase